MSNARREEIITQIRQSISLFENLIEKAIDTLTEIENALWECLHRGNKILLCGNGGSAADAQHIACELVVKLLHDRPSLPAIALTTNTSVLTAISNDLGFELSFARQIEGYGRKGDILILLTTSGNSRNIIEAAKVAREKKLVVIGLLGKNGGLAKDLCDYAIVVPSRETQRIQEVHIVIGHLLCQYLEEKSRTNTFLP
jgi:D-sedoheptulose 7-phosphate isomerase